MTYAEEIWEQIQIAEREGASPTEITALEIEYQEALDEEQA